MLIIKPEQRLHLGAIRRINELAFGRPNEAALVDALRESEHSIRGLSIVAQLDDQIVGHVLFTRIAIQDGDTLHGAAALAPLAVLPDFQNMGIGSHLVRYGLEKCEELGHNIVIVLGHQWYYTRFGFERASKYGIHPPFELENDGEFLVYSANQNVLSNIQGVVIYPKEFDKVRFLSE